MKYCRTKWKHTWSKPGPDPGGRKGEIALGPSLQGGAPWWNLFVSNTILVWKFRDSKAIQEYNSTLYSYVALCIKGPNSNWFLGKFGCLTVLVIAIAQPISIFVFFSIQLYLILLVTFPNNRSFGMGMTLYSCITSVA